MPSLKADVAIIGGGIVGLATAYRLVERRPGVKVVVLEKEAGVARHQTGRNSGVLHSGIYYKPGSLRAVNCHAGKLAMEAFCEAEGIPFDLCGKVIVATRDEELPRLDVLLERGRANGVACELLGPERLREIEPHAAGLRAIHVPEAGIVDYARVSSRLAEKVQKASGEILLGTRVTGIEERGAAVVVRAIVSQVRHGDATGAEGIPSPHPPLPSGEGGEVETIRRRNAGLEVEAAVVVNCAGLHSDRVAKLGGARPRAKIVPFRGEYFTLRPTAERLVRGLIYPVPDPRFPFLGVHFTRMIGGGVECGPNAVLAFAREGYTKTAVNLVDLAESLSYPGFLRMAARHWRTGLGEMWRSVSKGAFVHALQRLVPELRGEDLVPAPAGVRAQALGRDGTLVDDFLIEEEGRVVNVLNAPSPAATSALNIGGMIAEKVAVRLA